VICRFEAALSEKAASSCWQLHETPFFQRPHTSLS